MYKLMFFLFSLDRNEYGLKVVVMIEKIKVGTNFNVQVVTFLNIVLIIFGK